MNDSTQQQQNYDETVKMVDGQEVVVVNGVACPVDPYEREMCDSCQ